MLSIADQYIRALWNRYGLPGVVVGILIVLLTLIVVAMLAWWLDLEVVGLIGLLTTQVLGTYQ